MQGDWSLSGGDLETGGDLASAVIISLFTDRVASASDQIPVGTQDRRGWWGDLPLAGGAAEPIGSRLWLLSREKSTTATLLRARDYVSEALQWLISDGIASRIDVKTAYSGAVRETMQILITIYRLNGAAPLSLSYAWAWRAL